MPRRSGEQGVKPFELRTGVGGLPTLGGMFRSGDPAMIPPHKFHLLVNMRRTPGGMIARPGLALEFDTGIQECIDGLTEDAGLQGGAIMLYPGNVPSSNAATFRAIFPYSSTSYSEFVSALYGPATQSAAKSPVVQGLAGYVPASTEPVPESSPFIFRGQACYFARIERNGIPLQLALIAMELPGRSFLQTSNCWLQEQSGVVPACPGPAGIVAPPTFYPFQHPVGSATVVTYIDNPFAADGVWTADEFLEREQIVANPERIDDILTGKPGVGEVLYFLIFKGTGGEFRLLRWDGAQQTVESVTIPIRSVSTINPWLGLAASGPFLVMGSNLGPPGDWAAVRGDSGAWTYTLGAPVTDIDEYGPAVSWGGRGHLLANALSPNLGCGGTGVQVEAFQPGIGIFGNWDIVSCIPFASYQENSGSLDILDAVVCGPNLYVLLECVHFNARPWTAVSVGSFITGVPIGYVILQGDADVASAGNYWLQVVAGRVYVGGEFGRFVVSGTAGPANHAVYDVTDLVTTPATFQCNAHPVEGNGGNIFDVYLVLKTSEAGSPSQGALSAVPNDDHGGEGFQAS